MLIIFFHFRLCFCIYFSVFKNCRRWKSIYLFALVCFPSRSLKINDVLESDAEKLSDIAGDISEPSLGDSLQEADFVFVFFGLVIDYNYIELLIQLFNLLIYILFRSSNITYFYSIHILSSIFINSIIYIDIKLFSN